MNYLHICIHTYPFIKKMTEHNYDMGEKSCVLSLFRVHKYKTNKEEN